MMNNSTTFTPPMGPLNGMQQPFKSLSNEQLLAQLKSMATYGDHNHTTLMLLGELYQRAERSFFKTFAPTKEVHGDRYLYTSIFKNGVMEHYFVNDLETKENIQKVLAGTSSRTFDENISLLVELGPVFDVVTVNEAGTPVGESCKAGFPALFGFDGFNTQPLHPSKILPMAVLEQYVLPSCFHTFQLNDLLLGAFRACCPDLIFIDILTNYLGSIDVVKEYSKSIAKVGLADGLGPVVTQIHFFPADGEAPLKFFSGVVGQPNKGFVNRDDHPQLFVAIPNFGPINSPNLW